MFGAFDIDCLWHALRTISVEIMRLNQAVQSLFAADQDGLWAVPTLHFYFIVTA
jgi:hypothetical protein